MKPALMFLSAFLSFNCWTPLATLTVPVPVSVNPPAPQCVNR
jgi:hypothetical protein